MGFAIAAERGGFVLLAFAISLLVISLIPSQGLVSSGGSPAVPPQTFQSSPYAIFLTPQQNLVFTATVNGNADVFLLTVSQNTILDWISVHNVTDYTFNQTNLGAYLSANKGNVAHFWHGVANQTISESYTPTTVTNVTIVFSNLGRQIANIQFQTTVNAQLAPAARLQALYLWAFSLGVLLVLPQLIVMWNRRRSKLVSTQKAPSTTNPSVEDPFLTDTTMPTDKCPALIISNYTWDGGAW